MITHDDYVRIADTIARLPASWQTVQVRIDVFHALEAAAISADREARVAAWEKIRYLAGFPTGTGVRMPIFATMAGPASLDPYAGGEPPEFAELLATLNRAAGWEA